MFLRLSARIIYVFFVCFVLILKDNGVELEEFIESLCNDWKERDNQGLKDRILTSAEEQIKKYKSVREEYKQRITAFGQRQDIRSNNYLQHLKKRSLNENNMNLMNNISDICHGHVLIKLKITHGKIRLIDEFIWNINDNDNNNSNQIEQFSHILCADQGLPFKFAPTIAQSIRMQITEHKERISKCIKNEKINELNQLNDPLLHESLRYVGRNRNIGLKNLEMWQPSILVHKPPNRAKTKVRE